MKNNLALDSGPAKIFMFVLYPISTDALFLRRHRLTSFPWFPNNIIYWQLLSFILATRLKYEYGGSAVFRFPLWVCILKIKADPWWISHVCGTMGSIASVLQWHCDSCSQINPTESTKCIKCGVRRVLAASHDNNQTSREETEEYSLSGPRDVRLRQTSADFSKLPQFSLQSGKNRYAFTKQYTVQLSFDSCPLLLDLLIFLSFVY